MSRVGPIEERVLRSRKLLAQHAVITDAVVAAFRDENDDALPRSVIAALARIDHGSQVSAQKGQPDANHWLASSFYLKPELLSAASLRASRVIDGASGLGVSIGMPRRANDFTDVTPLGLDLFYKASLQHSRKGGPSLGVVDALFDAPTVLSVVAEHAPAATLADALLLSLVPFAKSHLTIFAQQKKIVLTDVESELAELSEALSGLRAGNLPKSLPPSSVGTRRDLLASESFQGLLQSAVRSSASGKGREEEWPPLIAAYLPGGQARLQAPDVRVVPLAICTLASTWLRVGWRTLPPKRKEAFLADFSSLVAGCAHEQAGWVETTLNRTIA
jgi:hypothetical protein